MGWIETSDRMPTEADAISSCVHVVFSGGMTGISRWDCIPNRITAWHPIVAPPPYVAPVKYRTPTIADLLNGPIDCEVGSDWLPAELRAIDTGTSVMAFWVAINDVWCWQLHCRIRDKS